MLYAVIPAKGRSVGIPRKNLVPLGGKPLVSWTITTAKQAGFITVVSTDSNEIADVSKQYGVDLVHERDPALSLDDTHATKVVMACIEWLHLEDGDIVGMFLPTSPFRSGGTVRTALSMLEQGGAESIVGVSKGHPYITYRQIGDGYLQPLIGKPIISNRQGCQPIYRVNGALFLSRVGVFKTYGHYHTDKTIPLIMTDFESVEIDDIEDLRFAQVLAGIKK